MPPETTSNLFEFSSALRICKPFNAIGVAQCCISSVIGFFSFLSPKSCVNEYTALTRTASLGNSKFLADSDTEIVNLKSLRSSGSE